MTSRFNDERDPVGWFILGFVVVVVLAGAVAVLSFWIGGR